MTKAEHNQSVTQAEAWLCGPLVDVIPQLMPAAHALVQAARDIERAALNLTTKELWTKPGGAPAVGFHLRHIAGSIDRLLTYACGEHLNEAQFCALATEAVPGESDDEPIALVHEALASIDQALQVLRSTPNHLLEEPRGVGRLQLPSSVFGILFHIAEHTQRHTGQIITTTRIAQRLDTDTECRLMIDA